MRKIKQFAAVILKPRGMRHEHEIVAELTEVCCENGLTITRDYHCLFTYENAFEFYAGHRGKWFRSRMATQLSSTITHGFMVEGENAIQILRGWVGPTDPVKAMVEAPESPRARFGRGNMKELAESGQVTDNAIHITSDPADWEREERCLAKAER